MLTGPTILVVLLLGTAIFVVPRKHLIVPYVLAACFVPADQRVIITDLDFTVLRILIVVGVLRVFLRHEQRVIKWNTFDKVVLCWAVCGAIIYVLRWLQIEAVIFKCGVLFDILGTYWVVRVSIRSWSDIKWIFGVLAVCLLLSVPLVALEWTTGRNPFVSLGSVTTYVRQGRFRCQGPFPISILMGLFWATLVPVFVGLAMTVGQMKLMYWAAAGAGIFLVIASASSTPVVILVVVLLVLCGYKWRLYTKHAFFGLFLMIVGLHIFMKAPVWHLVSRLNVVEGSTGWHRYHLIDQTIKHFGEWALLGIRTSGHWGPGMNDTTNQYIIEGLRGGLATLGLFIGVLIMAFRTLIRHFQRSTVPERQWLAWCFFIAILGHCLAFWAVAYFGDQIMFLWHFMLALVGFVYEISYTELKPLKRKPRTANS